MFIFCSGTISASNKNEQVLDRLQVEKERGITVKAQTATLFYTYKGTKYMLNLIDTPVRVLSLGSLYHSNNWKLKGPLLLYC